MPAEDDAKTMFCPIIRPQEGLSRCLGSNCMAWRWTEDIPPLGKTTERRFKKEQGAITTDLFEPPDGDGWKPVGPPSVTSVDGLTWVQLWHRAANHANAERYGYCGLASKPESF